MMARQQPDQLGDELPLSNAAQLRAAGRTPSLPFAVELIEEDGASHTLYFEQLLRVLPGKRLVGIAHYRGQRVLAKLFIAAHSARHWQRERDGIVALHAAGLPTPALMASAHLEGNSGVDGHALLSEFIADAHSLAERWQAVANPAGNAAGLALLQPAFALLGHLHAQGLIHEDLHLGNFLARGESAHAALLLIDGDAVRALSPGRPLPATAAMDNFALLAAQLPPLWDSWLKPLLASWQAAAPQLPQLDSDVLQQHIDRRRAVRIADYLAKSERNCSLFATARHGKRHSITVRRHAEQLATILADPDAALASGQLLKDGNTCTVAGVDVAGLKLVIKRYNIKHAAHALSRAWRPSRAHHAWRAGHLLSLLGIATPPPLAVIEERHGPLRGRAWLITAWSDGEDLAHHLAPFVDQAPPPATAQALIELFTAMQRHRISHGDFKASNLLWNEGNLILIDLDATRQHRSTRSHLRAWQRDRARLLRNWPQHSPLWQWLDQHLPKHDR